MHLVALLAVVAIPIGVLTGAIGLEHLEQRLLGYPGGDDLPRRAAPATRAPRPVPDVEPATVPLALPGRG